MQQADIWQLLQRLPRPDQPFVTAITAESRVELSGKTLINGIAKAANALRDVLDTEPGESIAVDLGWTWQQSVWQGAALISGLDLTGDHPTVQINPQVISTHPLGLPTGSPQDITSEVLGQPDAWMYPEYFADHITVIEQTRAWAEQHGINEGDRVGITAGHPDTAHRFAPFLAPLVTHGSVVFLTEASDNQIESVVEQERITRLL